VGQLGERRGIRDEDAVLGVLQPCLQLTPRPQVVLDAFAQGDHLVKDHGAVLVVLFGVDESALTHGGELQDRLRWKKPGCGLHYERLAGRGVTFHP
jgi:hypothetical protein